MDHFAGLDVHAADADAGGSKKDPEAGQVHEPRTPPVSKESSPCFLSVICFWRNYLSP
jgi:hypothetical protein